MRSRFTSTLSLLLLIALAVVVLLSWLLSATTGGDCRSLLSSEGIRFFLGGFVTALQKPLLVWIILLAMAWGTIRRSAIHRMFLPTDRNTLPQHLGLLAFVALSFLAVIILLTATPHAVLLSATGGLWPSPFSRALVPLLALWLVLMAVAYGVFTRRFLSFADVCNALTDGIASCAPLLLLYVLAIQLYESLRFVFP